MTEEAGQSRPSKSVFKSTAAAIVFVGFIVGAGAASNKLLNLAGIADEPGLTIEQRREKAHRNQEERKNGQYSDQRSTSANASKMCADLGIIETAKQLISDETPNLGNVLSELPDLEKARTGDPVEARLRDREKNLQDTKDYYDRNPVDPNDHTMGDQNAARAKRLSDLEKEIAELRQKTSQKQGNIDELRKLKNEIVFVDEPIPTDFDTNLNRVVCQVAYRVKGLGYDQAESKTAFYTVQPGQRGWIITLVSISD